MIIPTLQPTGAAMAVFHSRRFSPRPRRLSGVVRLIVFASSIVIWVVPLGLSRAAGFY